MPSSGHGHPEVTIERVEYDAEAVACKVVEVGPSEEYAEKLVAVE